jgi:hypothetical protein
MRAADDLESQLGRSTVICHLLEHGRDPLSVQRIVEALGALHSLAE